MGVNAVLMPEASGEREMTPTSFAGPGHSPPPQETAEPVIISATFRALNKRLKEVKAKAVTWHQEKASKLENPVGRPHVLHTEIADELEKISEELQDDFNALFAVLDHRVQKIRINLGRTALKGRELMALPDSTYTIGERIEWQPTREYLFNYAAIHNMVHHTDMMPEPPAYYPSRQLLIGSTEDGVVPLFRLADALAEGGYVRVEPVSNDRND